VVKRIFLSHADTDLHLARLIGDEVQRARPDIEVFVSSVPGAIPTGEEWLGEIKRQLKAADAYLTLLTPASVQRLWVWFESGAAFMSDKTFVGVCAPGMSKSAVPSPLSGHQLLSLDSLEECEQLFKEFGASLADSKRFLEAVNTAHAKGFHLFSQAVGWVGVQHGNRYFAWDGPLDSMEDRDPQVCPPGLQDAIKAVGMVPRFGNANKLEEHLANARLQVFLTDRTTWKRQVINDGKQVLLVHDASAPQVFSAFDVERALREQNEQRQRKAQMLHLDVGVKAADVEFDRLADDVERLAKQMTSSPLSFERFPDSSFVL
jgi:hypothetical protein